MTSSNTHPKWWLLYLTFPLLIALFVVDHRLKISTRGHTAVQIGIILLVYGLIYGWVKANSEALSRMDRKPSYTRVMIVQIPLSQLAETSAGDRSIFQLPSSEGKGMLSDTFEMDYIDALSYPVDEVPQELKRE
jgi:hypothetical protein